MFTVTKFAFNTAKMARPRTPFQPGRLRVCMSSNPGKNEVTQIQHTNPKTFQIRFAENIAVCGGIVSYYISVLMVIDAVCGGFDTPVGFTCGVVFGGIIPGAYLATVVESESK